MVIVNTNRQKVFDKSFIQKLNGFPRIIYFLVENILCLPIVCELLSFTFYNVNDARIIVFPFALANCVTLTKFRKFVLFLNCKSTRFELHSTKN